MAAFSINTDCNGSRTLVGAVAGFLGTPYTFLYFIFLYFRKHMGKYTKKLPTPPTIVGMFSIKADTCCDYLSGKGLNLSELGRRKRHFCRRE